MGSARCARAYVLLLLFLYDWIARVAHDYRDRHSGRAHGHGPSWQVYSAVLQSARSKRSVLALRGYCVDLSVSSALSHRRALHRGWPLMSEHIVAVKIYIGIFVALL